MKIANVWKDSIPGLSMSEVTALPIVPQPYLPTYLGMFLSLSLSSLWIFRSVLIVFYKLNFFEKWANPGLFLFIFVLFSLQFQYKLKKAEMVCLGFEHGAAVW